MRLAILRPRARRKEGCDFFDNVALVAENVLAFHKERGTCERLAKKKGEGAINSRRLWCRSFDAVADR